MKLQSKKNYKIYGKKAFSWITFLILLLCIAFVCFIVYLKFDAIETAIIGEQKIETNDAQTNLLLEEELSLSGEIQETNDLLTYSHYLTDQEYGKIYLKSRNFNLFDYTGAYIVEGIVDEFYDSYPVLEITKLKEIKTNSNDGEQQISSGAIITGSEDKIEEFFYDFPEMGIWFDTEFSNTYTLNSQTENELTFVQSGVENAIPFRISAFDCGNSGSSDCSTLLATFKKSAEDTITNPIALTLYKMSEIKTWFFVNNISDQEFAKGYYINGAESSTVQDLSNHLFVNNEWYVKNILSENISDFCYDENVILQKYDTFNLYQQGNNLYVNIDYNSRDTGKVECKLELQGAEVLTKEFKYSDYEEETSDTSSGADTSSVIPIDEEIQGTEEEKGQEKETETTDENFNIAVEQFQLKPEKSLTFSSARGHKIVFPSPNIAYQEVSTSEDFDQEGVHCFADVKVIKYTDETKLLDSPTLEVYECTVKDSFDDSATDLIYKKIEIDGKTKNFVIKINDPSWYEFAKNIDIE